MSFHVPDAHFYIIFGKNNGIDVVFIDIDVLAAVAQAVFSSFRAADDDLACTADIQCGAVRTGNFHAGKNDMHGILLVRMYNQHTVQAAAHGISAALQNTDGAAGYSHMGGGAFCAVAGERNGNGLVFAERAFAVFGIKCDFADEGRGKLLHTGKRFRCNARASAEGSSDQQYK